MSQVESTAETSYVSGKYLKANTIEDREYQSALVDAALTQSTLVALPTGTGKTPVALRVADQRLADFGGKILMLAPTQPLVQQHAEFFREMLEIPDHEIKIFTGDVRPDDRAEQWNGATSIVLATPQVIENDLVGSRYDLNDVSYLVFDECHRATGEYSYNYIAERYHGNAENPLVTGLSASPGSNKDDILTVCKNLGITSVEVLTEDDESLKKYLSDTDITYTRLDMPDEILGARDIIQDVYQKRLKRLKNGGVMKSAAKDVSFKQLQSARGKIQGLINNNDSAGYELASVHAEAMKLYHALKIIESQGVEATESYFAEIEADANSSDGTKAAKKLIADADIQKARTMLSDFTGVHPKLTQVAIEVGDTLRDNGQVLIFSEYRSTVENIVEFLDRNDDVNPARFVGQKDKSDNPGMSQEEQKETIQKFRDGEYNVLVATSVAEEGLDIPAVDLVLMFEPIPSGIRAIQRRGRTGRESDGRVVVLMANDTRDEQKYWISQHREDSMKEDMNELKDMEETLNQELRDEQAALTEFGERLDADDDPVVIVDSRETQSSITKTLDRMPDVQIMLETIDVGDYVMSDRVAVERKTHQDFLDTLTGGDDRDLFDQMGDLTSNYSKSMLILEGEDGVEGLYSRSQVPRNAIEGALASVAVDFGVSVLHTENEDSTASLMATLAKREQTESDREVSAHGKKQTDTKADQQEYLISSIGNVGPVLAQNLLMHFGSPRAVLTASIDELVDVEKVGETTAKQIREVIDDSYSPD